jgi:hypothetical protein
MNEPLTDLTEPKPRRRLLPESLRKALPKIALESFFIVLSILVALGVSEWNKARQERAQQREALRNIRNEISINKEVLEESMAYHRQVRSRFADLAKRPDQLTQKPFLSVFEEMAP